MNPQTYLNEHGLMMLEYNAGKPGNRAYAMYSGHKYDCRHLGNNGRVCCRIFIASLIGVQVILKHTSEYVHESIFLSREIHLERGSQYPVG